MKTTSEFVGSLNDVFSLFGAIEARRMFGGYGIYHDGLMFALVADDVLYLKTDENSAGFFVEPGLQQFEYEKSGRKMRMSYYAAPEEVFDDPQLAKEWASRAYEAALRARKPKKKPTIKGK
jgi:DNA transformation protein